jgi:hypothetical protein
VCCDYFEPISYMVLPTGVFYQRVHRIGQTSPVSG